MSTVALLHPNGYTASPGSLAEGFTCLDCGAWVNSPDAAPARGAEMRLCDPCDAADLEAACAALAERAAEPLPPSRIPEDADIRGLPLHLDPIDAATTVSDPWGRTWRTLTDDVECLEDLTPHLEPPR